MRLNLIAVSLSVLLISSCSHRSFSPVNVGREYGPPKDLWLVSHLPKKNQWALARTDHHNVFQKIICFNAACCRMIGRRKAMKAISYEDFKKRIRKNAKKGEYKKETVPVSPKQNVDTLITKKVDSSIISESKGATTPSVPILKADSLITLNEFLFEINSYKLNKAHFSELDMLSNYLIKRPSLKISITGHTDNTGHEHHNVTLSTQRAEAVAQYLIDKGISEDNMFFEGFGSSRPIAGNDTEQGRSKNRRVEILLSNPEK